MMGMGELGEGLSWRVAIACCARVAITAAAAAVRRGRR